MSDPFPGMEPWEAYEAACNRIAELKAENDRLREALAEIREIYAGSEGIPVAERLIGHVCPCKDEEPAIVEDKGDFVWRGISK